VRHVGVIDVDRVAVGGLSSAGRCRGVALLTVAVAGELQERCHQDQREDVPFHNGSHFFPGFR